MSNAMGASRDVLIDFDPSPVGDLRAALAREINGFHARTVPQDSARFGLFVRDGGDVTAGMIGVLSWQWLFVEAVWVGDTQRRQGVGRALMARAETHAIDQGCHSAWLDTFQAKAFYEGLGYEAFGALEAYPPGQTRHFMRKRLRP